MKTIITKQYKQWLADIKQNIGSIRLQTALQVNANMLFVYWYIGKQIHQKIEVEGWGTKVVEQLSRDLQKAFPDMQGFSARNLVYMRKFAAENLFNEFTQQVAAQIDNRKNKKNKLEQQPVAQLEFTQQAAAQIKKQSKISIGQQAAAQLEITQQLAAQFMQQPAAQIPWGHHMLLLDKTTSGEERKWYIEQTIKNAWSRNVLLHHISTELYKRQGKNKKFTNFHLTLPKTQSDLANQILKDPYQFDFLQLSESFSEQELEKKLIEHIQLFLIELGEGFAFVGRQYKLQISRKEYQFDLLFYHLGLRCYVIIELKIGEFQPMYAGQMNAYINATNKLLKKEHDNSTIGIILCTEKDEVDVEFALEGMYHPIGVSEYKTLPKNLRDKLPSAKQLKDAVKAFNRKMKTKK